MERTHAEAVVLPRLGNERFAHFQRRIPARSAVVRLGEFPCAVAFRKRWKFIDGMQGPQVDDAYAQSQVAGQR